MSDTDSQNGPTYPEPVSTKVTTGMYNQLEQHAEKHHEGRLAAAARETMRTGLYIDRMSLRAYTLLMGIVYALAVILVGSEAGSAIGGLYVLMNIVWAHLPDLRQLLRGN